jgi:hypothetical protein
MTLGVTPTGAIKIKTDEAGGGLRAVECACCGGECGFFDWMFSQSCPDYYDASESEYMAWRRGGILDFTISYSHPDASSSISESGSLVIPANSCFVTWHSDSEYPDNYISFSYGFLKVPSGKYIFAYTSFAGLDQDDFIQLMSMVQDWNADGVCQCATPNDGPFPPETYVAGRGYCPYFGFNYGYPILANINFVPTP